MGMIQDRRNIATGYEIPKESYCDQPYVVKTDDGAWLCTLTTGAGQEGHSGQHVISTRSTDMGKTWSERADIEPPGPPEASWVMPLKVPGGRIYAFYLHNTDNIREVIADTEYARKRVDTLGHYMYRFSDDHGRSWSAQRYEIPIRATRMDWENPYKGKVRFFWGVGKPMVHGGKAYIGFSKVGRLGEGFLASSEGFFLCSENILAERNPARIRWELLPDGDVGLTAPEGPIAEEHNLVAMNDGSLYCTYRTVQGHNCHAYSRDGGHTWDGPQYAAYSNGRLVKHPRAANFVRKFSNGKYLLWYHNHGGKTYAGRNPAWLCGGVERDGVILWSQPEIVLYDDDPETRISYPDFIEDEGRYFITETQKTVACVHEIDRTLLEGLWNQRASRTIADDGRVLSLTESQLKPGTSVPMPRLPDLSGRGGFTVELWVNFANVSADQILLDNRAENGKGIALTTTDRGTVKLAMNDGRRECAWDCDPGVLLKDTLHHIVAIVDGGPKIISFVVDGILCDGGESRQYGWGRFVPAMGDVNGSRQLKVALRLNGRIRALRLYDRYLRTSEAVGNFNAGR